MLWKFKLMRQKMTMKMQRNNFNVQYYKVLIELFNNKLMNAHSFFIAMNIR